MVQLLRSAGEFQGLSHEDPQQHLQTFLEISDTYIPEDVNVDYVRLALFPFSLSGEVDRWLLAEPHQSITTWEDCARRFLIQFFPSQKITRLRSEILSFGQKDGENLYQTWERFKEGLVSNTKILLDSAAGGQALEKTYEELYTLLNRIAQGIPNWHADSRNAPKKVAGVLEVDQFTALQAQIAAMQNHMTTQLNNLKLGTTQPAATINVVQQVYSWCKVCESGEHKADACSVNPNSVNHVGNANRQGQQNFVNTYNPNWRNHPNFSWVENQVQNTNQYKGPVQPNPQPVQKNQATASNSNVEEILKQFMAQQA
ncbi:uncharacterized protein LOC124885906 [Capsicum annuum]|uniref:uncharacterized protein LOC124885906 n=1 Tax=Capsicum annuum TaxID=4072 RepID=UPI001FB15DDB|nr:uncharacterized protein LOC124885906 [Capsicum annuum]